MGEKIKKHSSNMRVWGSQGDMDKLIAVLNKMVSGTALRRQDVSQE